MRKRRMAKHMPAVVRRYATQKSYSFSKNVTGIEERDAIFVNLGSIRLGSNVKDWENHQ